MTNPIIRGTLDVRAIIKRAAVATKDNNAVKRALKCGGKIRGIVKTAGIPLIIGMVAAKPATTGDRPPVSKILGSQLLKPWPTAKDKNPIMRISWIFRTLMTAKYFINAGTLGSFSWFDIPAE